MRQVSSEFQKQSTLDKILQEERAKNDMMLFGTGFLRTHPDGTQERINPMEMQIMSMNTDLKVFGIREAIDLLRSEEAVKEDVHGRLFWAEWLEKTSSKQILSMYKLRRDKA